MNRKTSQVLTRLTTMASLGPGIESVKMTSLMRAFMSCPTLRSSVFPSRSTYHLVGISVQKSPS